MDSGKRQAKPTGFTPGIRTGKGKGLAPAESTGAKKALPISKNAPMRGGSQTTGGELTAAKLLAVQVLLADFRALKLEMPQSWIASSNGKIYWCAEIPGHKLAIIDGKLLVDHLPVENVLTKLLAEP